MEKTVLTLCIIRREGRILLGKNKIGMGKGKWNGPGGHVQDGESLEEAAKRETLEEIGVTPTDLEKAGVLRFASPLRPPLEMHIFKATEFEGEPVETDAMIPEWFTKDMMPFREMWASDLYWWPCFFKNRLFVGEFEYDKDDRVVSHDVRIVATLP